MRKFEKFLILLFLAVTFFLGVGARDKTFRELSPDTSPTADDLLITLDDPSGTPQNKKVTVNDLRNALYGVKSIDSSQPDQGVYTTGSVKHYVDGIGTSKSATLLFAHDGTGNTTTYTFSTSVTIPSNIRVIREEGAILHFNDGAILTQNGPFESPISKAFTWTGTGKITFGPGAVEELYSELWGIDGVADQVELNKAIVASNGDIPVKMLDKDYITAGSVLMNKPVHFKGVGRKASLIKPNADTFPAIQIYADADYTMNGWRLEGFGIDYGTKATNAAAKGIFLDDTGGALRYPYMGIIQDIGIYNAYHGIYDDTRAFMISLSDVFVGTIAGTGFYFVNASGKTTISFRNCYANACDVRAFNLEGILGLTMDVCAFDGSTSASSLMRISSCRGEISGLDFEGSTYSGAAAGLIDIANSYITFNGLISYNNTISGNGGSLVRTSSAARVIFNMPFLGGSRSDAYSGTNTYYTLNISSDTDFVRLDGDNITALTGTGGTAVAIVDYGYKAIKTRAAPIIDNTNASTSGAGEDDLKTATIYAHSLGTYGGLRILAAGSVTNVNNGNKTIKLHFGGSSLIVLPAADDNDDWWVEAEIFATGEDIQRIHWRAGRCSDTAAEEVTYSGYQTMTIDTTANVTLKLTGECADAGDTIRQTMWIIERLSK